MCPMNDDGRGQSRCDVGFEWEEGRQRRSRWGSFRDCRWYVKPVLRADRIQIWHGIATETVVNQQKEQAGCVLREKR